MSHRDRGDVKPIATDRVVCDGPCHKLRTCGLYTLQDGSTAWVCVECREGRK